MIRANYDNAIETPPIRSFRNQGLQENGMKSLDSTYLFTCNSSEWDKWVVTSSAVIFLRTLFFIHALVFCIISANYVKFTSLFILHRRKPLNWLQSNRTKYPRNNYYQYMDVDAQWITEKWMSKKENSLWLLQKKWRMKKEH